MLRRADGWLLDALYPERTACLVCARPSHGERLCPVCAAELDALRLDGARDGWMGAAYRYQGAARKLVHQLKYGCVEDAARLLALAMTDTARGMRLPPDTVVTWVSMPERRRRMRGIDHGRLLAEHVAARLGLPCRALLERTGHGRGHTQRGLGRAARLRNLQGAFRCAGDIPPHVLLVDDVRTTGSTLRVCTACLREGGARRVETLTDCRVPGRDDTGERAGREKL